MRHQKPAPKNDTNLLETILCPSTEFDRNSEEHFRAESAFYWPELESGCLLWRELCLFLRLKKATFRSLKIGWDFNTFLFIIPKSSWSLKNIVILQCHMSTRSDSEEVYCFLMFFLFNSNHYCILLQYNHLKTPMVMSTVSHWLTSNFSFGMMMQRYISTRKRSTKTWFILQAHIYPWAKSWIEDWNVDC